MKIHRLLELHNQFSDPISLKKNLGDGFLIKNNRIFRNIRLTTVENQYSFNDKPSSDFQALPFSQLETILQNKSIPYVDNVNVLEKLVHRLKDTVTWNDISDGYKRNYVFHEACHAVARSYFEKLLKDKYDLSTLDGQRKKCLQILTEEAFANTCELLGALDAQDQAHKLFYEVNSYTFLFESRTFLKRAFNELGEDFIFKLFLMLYLYSNFLKPGLDDKLFNRTIQFLSQNSRLNLDMKSMKNLKELSKLPFTLDLRFRTITTGLHLRLSGVDQDISKIVDFDILGFVSKDTNRTNYINEITGIALKK